MSETSKRLTRHEMQEPDQFLTAFDHAVKYYRSHRHRVVVIAVATVVVVLAALIGLSTYRGRAARANQALGQLLAIEERPVRGNEDPAAPPAAKAEPFPDQASKDTALIAEADAVLAAHTASRVARGAKLVKAQALLGRGQAQEALPLLAEIASSSPSDAIEVAAVFAQASARAAVGDSDAAVAELTRLASSGSPFVPKDLALKRAAELSALAGHADQAAKLYRRVADETPQSPLAAEAKTKAEELAAGPAQATASNPATHP